MDAGGGRWSQMESAQMKRVRIQLLDDNVAAGTLAEIEDALQKVNGRAKSFAITSAAIVVGVIKRAERYLTDYSIPSADRGGATVTYRPGGPSANSYGYSATSTQIKLRRKAGSATVWYLEDVARTEVYPRKPEKFSVAIDDRAAGSLLKRTLAAFGRNALPVDDEQKIAA
jgi:hypothetical protein